MAEPPDPAGLSEGEAALLSGLSSLRSGSPSMPRTSGSTQPRPGVLPAAHSARHAGAGPETSEDPDPETEAAENPLYFAKVEEMQAQIRELQRQLKEKNA